MTPQPVPWALITLLLSTLALETTNPVLLAVLVASLLASGVMLGGPRTAVLTAAAGGCLAATVAWFLFALLGSGDGQAPAAFTLPTWRVGGGATLGGPVTWDALGEAGIGALRAACVILAVALALQAVPGLAWLRLARETLGWWAPLAAGPALLGEAVAGATAAGQREARAGWRRRPGTWLSDVVVICCGAARHLPGPSRHADGVRTGCATLAAAAVLAVGAGTITFPGQDLVTPLDLVGLAGLALVVVGHLLPRPQRPRTRDLAGWLVALALLGAWSTRFVTREATLLTATPASPPLILGAAVLALPVAVATTTRGRTSA